MQKKSVVIVSPALADANNGNWQTAWRWQRMLSPIYRTRIVREWPQDPEAGQDAVMLALHARRSAASIAAWGRAHPGRGLVVVLTGTDLYRDIQSDASAQQSLALAQRLVVLQERGPDALPAALRGKAHVVFQSTTTRQALPKTAQHLRAVMVGHLREVKSPDTLCQAARLLKAEPDIAIDQIGDALEPALGELARATAADCPSYRWLGGLPHEAVRRRIQRAHVLVHASRMEGGAHVVMEAVASGTPVLASRVPGNVGMLGPDYAGYFKHGDADALAGLLVRCRDGLRQADGPGGDLLSRLRAQCQLRAPLFAPDAERATLRHLLHELLEMT
ncbi:MAG: selenoneine biosynthesis selenosugar synthase SenB [Burkholderiaceae bacterium]